MVRQACFGSRGGEFLHHFCLGFVATLPEEHNNLSYDAKGQYGVKAMSRIAKCDYILLYLNLATTDESTYTKGAMVIFEMPRKFCKDDGFVNPLQKTEWDDPEKHLMIPYSELNDKPMKKDYRMVKGFTVNWSGEIGIGDIVEEFMVEDYENISQDDRPNGAWRNWAKATYGNAWKVVQVISSETGK